MRGGTARDTLVALLGEAKADEVIEQAARAEYASERATDEGWDREGSKGRELHLMPVTAALAAVLPDPLAPEVITTREEADLLPNGAVAITGDVVVRMYGGWTFTATYNPHNDEADRTKPVRIEGAS